MGCGNVLRARSAQPRVYTQEVLSIPLSGSDLGSCGQKPLRHSPTSILITKIMSRVSPSLANKPLSPHRGFKSEILAFASCGTWARHLNPLNNRFIW